MTSKTPKTIKPTSPTNNTKVKTVTKKTRSHTHATATTTEGTSMTTTPSKTTDTHASAATNEAASLSSPVPATTAIANLNPPPTSGTTGAFPYIETCSALLDALAGAFPEGDPITATDKKRQAKARKGSERYIPKLVSLARIHGVNLALVPLDQIASDSSEAAALVSFQQKLESINKRVKDRMFNTQSSSWSGSSKLYSVLRRLGKDNGVVAAGLAPVEEFFNYRHPSVAKDHPKTAKGKAALKAQRAAEAAAAVAPAAPAPVNGAGGTNGAAHS